VSNLCAVKARTQRGPFAVGDQVQLTDPKGRMHQIVLSAGGTFHTHRGSLSHDDLIGSPEGSVVTASSGTAYVALRPLLADYTLAMKRGATIVYPKDAAQILAYADVFPGARVLEAGAGSGALSCWLLRAIGPDGELVSFEARSDFAEIARENVRKYFGEVPPWWRLVTGELSAAVALDPTARTRADYARLHRAAGQAVEAGEAGEPEPQEAGGTGGTDGQRGVVLPGDDRAPDTMAEPSGAQRGTGVVPREISAAGDPARMPGPLSRGVTSLPSPCAGEPAPRRGRLTPAPWRQALFAALPGAGRPPLPRRRPAAGRLRRPRPRRACAG
jgi:hypothetical protein